MKKILLTILAVIITATPILSVFTNQAHAKEYPTENYDYSIDMNIIETFIESIKSSQNITIDKNNLIDYVIEDGVITLIVANESDGFTVYRSLSDEEQLTLNADAKTLEMRKSIWGFVHAVYKGTKLVCKMVEYGTGEDLCAMIGSALLKTMVPNVRYKAVSTLHKNPNCAPPHSQQCNMYPNVYWETTVVRA